MLASGESVRAHAHAFDTVIHFFAVGRVFKGGFSGRLASDNRKFREINIISCVIGSPTDYMAEWKFGSTHRQNEKNKIFQILKPHFQNLSVFLPL